MVKVADVGKPFVPMYIVLRDEVALLPACLKAQSGCECWIGLARPIGIARIDNRYLLTNLSFTLGADTIVSARQTTSVCPYVSYSSAGLPPSAHL